MHYRWFLNYLYWQLNSVFCTYGWIWQNWCWMFPQCKKNFEFFFFFFMECNWFEKFMYHTFSGIKVHILDECCSPSSCWHLRTALSVFVSMMAVCSLVCSFCVGNPAADFSSNTRQLCLPSAWYTFGVLICYGLKILSCSSQPSWKMKVIHFISQMHFFQG